MAANKKPFLLLAFFLPFLLADHVTGARKRTQTPLSDARQCRIQQLQASRPSRRLQSEGGVTELWNEFDDQFQCAGVAALRNILQPNSLSLPSFSPSPYLAYIEKGQGLIGITYPGCPETFDSREQQSSPNGSEKEQEQPGRRFRGDQHQKIRRARQGDIVAIPPGAAHWCLNDGQEELVVVAVANLNNQANVLDQSLRSFYLAGNEPQMSSEGKEKQKEKEWQGNFGNILSPFDENLLAEAFDVPIETVRQMKKEDKRGIMVKVKGGVSVIKPDEGEEHREGIVKNGLEETYCSMKINQNLDNPSDADVFSRQAGRLNSANMEKLTVLGYVGMSAMKGSLYPNALYVPHWKMNAHSTVYITQGEGQLQVVNYNGQTVFNGRVIEGDLIVIPQFFVVVTKAGNKGLEWVNFQTSPLPLENPLAGTASTFRGMPLEVLTSSYQMYHREAREVKYGRDGFTKLVPSTVSSS